MEVKTVHGIMDIHIGARYAEVYLPISPLGLVIIWEVISLPEVKEESDGSRLISWIARNTNRLMRSLHASDDYSLIESLKKKFKKHESCMKSEICYYCDEHDIKYQTQVYY